MANNHSVAIGTHACFWNVDALNLVGIAAADIDNGRFVALGDIAKSATTDVLDEYVFTVAVGANNDYIVLTPPQGYGIEAALYADPRYFTNEAGKPMSVKRLMIGDCIEVSKDCFSTAPTAGTSTHASVDANGKLVASTTNTDAFKILAAHNFDIGGAQVESWILMKLK